MGADNWDYCPRCKVDVGAKIKELERKLQDDYGIIGPQEWLTRKALTDSAIRELEDEGQQTWRENYEFYGANEGVLKIRYGAYCTECGLEFEYDEDVPFYEA